MSIHLHTYTYIHTYIHTHTYTGTHRHSHTHARTHTHTHTHKHIQIHTRTRTHTHTHIHMHARTLTHALHSHALINFGVCAFMHLIVSVQVYLCVFVCADLRLCKSVFNMHMYCIFDLIINKFPVFL